jgi:hypothetical protein|tara:strand:- start:2394 stop:2495 length:102 start_codon:yes stop_codon:yes gene_type:complete
MYLFFLASNVVVVEPSNARGDRRRRGRDATVRF